MAEINRDCVQTWPYIPINAFLYFPQGEQLKIGNEQKQWRKIFEGGQQYTPFQNQAINKLQQRLIEKKLTIDAWFDQANRLRFLQANKFKIGNTVDAMVQYTKWRASNFPVSVTAQIQKMLNSGAFYFCGRDSKYRPIIVADISKFDPDDVDIIPETLVILMEFMINNLLIEGQVENYILIMNLKEFSFSLRSVVMKILGFTSNSYRGRLFASYLLSMPSVLNWGWEALASKFVSENTIKKIKISKEMVNPEMWGHISKNIVEQQYGGNMQNLRGGYWPPRQQLMLFTQPSEQTENHLITVAEYKQLVKAGRLPFRKIHKQLMPSSAPPPQSIKSSRIVQTPRISRELIESPKYNIRQSIVEINGDVPGKNTKINIIIKTETSFVEKYHTISTFFQNDSFKRITRTIDK